jgi:hypothetical protein
MYCPRCSQQQASEEMRYCSRCGFPLEGVAALLAGGGHPEPAGPDREGPLTPRQRGTRKGLMMVAGGLLFLKLAFVLTLFKEDFFVLMLPASLLLIAGVMRGLYGLLLESDAHHSKRLRTAVAAEDAARELPAAQTQTLPPASVADGTTRLLEKDEPALRPRK